MLCNMSCLDKMRATWRKYYNMKITKPHREADKIVICLKLFCTFGYLLQNYCVYSNVFYAV